MGSTQKKSGLTAEDRELIQSMKKQLIAMGVTNVKEQAQLIQQELALRKNTKGGVAGTSKGGFQGALDKIKSKFQSVSQKVLQRTLMKGQPTLSEEDMAKMFGGSQSDSIPGLDQNLLDEFGQIDEETLGQHGTFLDDRNKKKHKEVSMED